MTVDRLFVLSIHILANFGKFALVTQLDGFLSVREKQKLNSGAYPKKSVRWGEDIGFM